MKKLIFLLLLTYLILPKAFALKENDSSSNYNNNFWGANLSLNQSFAYTGIYLSPALNYYLKGKHNFFIGPNILILPENLTDQMYINFSQQPQEIGERLGVNAGYRYYFKPVGKRVNFGLMYRFQYNRGNFIINYGYIEHFKLDLITQTVGYNLKIKLFDNFYLSQELGLGIFHKTNGFKKAADTHISAGVGYWFKK